MANSISTQISEQVVKFQPGGEPASFDIAVINDSDRFAAFQLEIIAAGADAIPGLRWYRLSPEVSSKKPPGDRTQFTTLITDSPVPGFSGIMNLTVRIFSLELGEETREVVRLVVEQSKELTPVKLTLPVAQFSAYPNDLLEIPVNIHNPSQLTANVVLSFLGVDLQWLVQGHERRLQIPPGGKTETTFSCQLPIPSQVPSQPYPFTIEANSIDGLSSRINGTITVLPKGFVEFSCIPKELQMPPSTSAWWIPKWKCHSAVYLLRFDNASNLHPDVTVEVQPEARQRKSTWEIIPEKANISPGQITDLQLVVKKHRHWWGGTQRLRFEVKARESKTGINIRNDTQFLKLNLLPVLPIWMQILIGAGLLILAWAVSPLNQQNHNYGHADSVNSVQFNGIGNNAISGGNDQKIIKWDSAGLLNPLINQFEGDFGQLDKAVRVVRYRPVDNNLVAAGLENGEIRLFNLAADNNQPINSFLFQPDDRVLALEFTKNSRFLFSGHGSGLVLQWDVQSDLENNRSREQSPFKQKKFDFAVYALAQVGKAQNNLMIGGRLNQLRMWNFVTDQVRSLPYQEGSKDDYIQSISVAAYKPDLMVTSDTQGYITLWNLEQCLTKDVDCTISDRWGNGHGGKPVRSVVINRNGCYVASGGDDGRVVLWPLGQNGKRHPQFANGQEVGRSEKRINSVDIKRYKKDVFILNGGDDTQVMIYTTPQSNTGCK